MKLLSASTATALIVGFMAESCKVVLANGPDGPVRVNKADFDADQEKDEADRRYTPYEGADEVEQTPMGRTAIATAPADMPVIADPSAPDFTGGTADGSSLLIDERKNAAAPVTHAPDSRLVKAEGTGKNRKFYVINGKGDKLKAADGVNEDGYETEALAWKAVTDLPR